MTFAHVVRNFIDKIILFMNKVILDCEVTLKNSA